MLKNNYIQMVTKRKKMAIKHLIWENLKALNTGLNYVFNYRNFWTLSGYFFTPFVPLGRNNDNRFCLLKVSCYSVDTCSRVPIPEPVPNYSPQSAPLTKRIPNPTALCRGFPQPDSVALLFFVLFIFERRDLL